VSSPVVVRATATAEPGVCGEALSNHQPFNTPDIVSASPTTKLSFSSIRLSRAMLLHFPDHFKQYFEEETERRCTFLRQGPPSSTPARANQNIPVPIFQGHPTPHTKSSSSSSQFQNPNFCKTSPSASRQSRTPRRSAPAPTPTKPPARNEEEMCEFASTAMPTS